MASRELLQSDDPDRASESPPPPLAASARGRRVFVNRNLRMESIALIGFDMDYTLAVYDQRALDRLQCELTLRKLVEKRGYHESILTLGYPSELAIRGLLVDSKRGNVLKLNRYGHVSRAMHGSHPLSRAERVELYRKQILRFAAPRFAWIDTLFALPEVVLYLRLTEHLEKSGGRLDPARLWQDVRECIDEAHRDGSLKSLVKRDPARFVVPDPALPDALLRFRAAGKRLFLLTNSHWDYTEVLMRHVLDGRHADHPSWRSYFDIVIVGGGKPGFFGGGGAFVELDPESGSPLASGEPLSALLPGRVYQGGNLADFERLAGAAGDRVLYVGDHIYGDILRAKRSSVWRTCMIVQEIEAEIATAECLAPRLSRLASLDLRRERLEDEMDGLLARPAACGAQPDGDIDAGMLDRLRDEHARVCQDIERLEGEIERAFNSHWGPLFKDGNENSRFGEQVEDYACLYTSRVSNFAATSPRRYFQSPRERMPHDL